MFLLRTNLGNQVIRFEARRLVLSSTEELRGIQRSWEHQEWINSSAIIGNAYYGVVCIIVKTITMFGTNYEMIFSLNYVTLLFAGHSKTFRTDVISARQLFQSCITVKPECLVSKTNWQIEGF